MQSGPDQTGNEIARPGPPAIEIAGLSHWYGEGKMRRQVLEGVDLSIASGEVVLLTGPSGCGKTTLLTLVGALRQVQAGQVKVFGQELAGSSRRERQQLRRSSRGGGPPVAALGHALPLATLHPCLLTLLASSLLPAGLRGSGPGSRDGVCAWAHGVG